MGIDVVRIGVYVWKFLRLSFITSYRFFRKDPYVGVILISIFLLYMFLPLFFIVLVVCSPLIVLIAVILRVYLRYKRAKLQNANQVEKKNKCEAHSSRSSGSFKDDDVIILRNNGTTISRHMSRRTNFTDKNRLNLEKKDDIVALTANTMELLGLTSQNEDKSKVLLDVNKSGSVDHEEGCAAEKVIVSESWSGPEDDGDDDDDDDDDETQEDRNKGVEWTDDDQKNLMDLGISEIERNKRLETLISKRREKKEGGKGPNDTDQESDISSATEIGPVAVSRTTPSNTPNSKDLPGSAPPILLPSRSPFDLPYDPLEEKPNLMGDNFHEELTAAQPKDLVFSRHESFLLGTSSSLQPKKGDNDQLDDKIQDKKNQVAEDIGESGASELSLECLDAEQLIGTLRVHPSPELLHKDNPENLKSVNDRDDETNSENTDDISEKQYAHEGTKDTQETVEERDKFNSIIEGAEEGASKNLADKDHTADNHGTLQADKEPNDRLLQSSAAASSMLRDVNETLMSEIMNEEKDTSFEKGEVVSQISTLEEPVPELLTTVDESELRTTRDNEAESNHSSDAIQTFKSEPESSAEDSAVVDNRVNHDLIGQSEVESHASAGEEHVPEPLATTEESNSRSTEDIEGENKHTSEDILSNKGESEGIDKNSTEMNNRVNH